MKYTYSYTLGSGVPLGGIGTGSFDIRADGRLYEWTIFNNGSYAERQDLRYTYYLNELDSFIVVRNNEGKARILQSFDYYYGASPYNVPWLKPIKEIEYIGEPPIAYLTFKDSFNVKMKAFSPFIPHDIKNSSLPTAILKISTDEPSDFIFGIKNPFENGKIETKDDMIIFSGNTSDRDPRYNGNLCVKIIGEKPFTSKLTSFPNLKEWSEFRQTGKITAKSGDNIGLIGARGKEVTIIISWYFPNHLLENGKKVGHYYENFFSNCVDVADYVSLNLNYLETKTTQFHDLLYFSQGIENWISDLVGSQLSTLIKSTWLGKDGFFGIWEGYFNTADVRKNGQYPYTGGPLFTALNTIDVLLNSMYSILVLFPEFAKNIIKNTASNILDENKLDYIIYALAINENRQKYLEKISKDPSIPTNFEKLLNTVKEIVKETGKDPRGRVPHLIMDNSKVDSYDRNDLNPEFVLLWYLTSKMTGDKELLASIYDKAKEAIDSILRTHSYEGLMYNRLPVGVDWMRVLRQEFKDSIRGVSNSILPILGYDMLTMSMQTYDDWTMLGITSFESLIWLASLQAINEASFKLKKDYKYDIPLQTFIKYLWNGEYFDLWYDPISGYRDKASNASQLIGEWYMTLLDMNLLDKEIVRKTLKSIMNYNFKEEEGVVNGAYPDGYRPFESNYENPLNLPASIQLDTPWSGVEFYVASHLIYEKMVNEGVRVLKEIYDKYTVAGDFWNHLEYGGHYLRALSAITIIPAFEGLVYDAFSNSLSIDPAVNELTWILLLPSAWGKISINGSNITITVVSGNLKLNVLKLKHKPTGIKLNGVNVEFKVEENDRIQVLVNLDLKEGDVLEII